MQEETKSGLSETKVTRNRETREVTEFRPKRKSLTDGGPLKVPQIPGFVLRWVLMDDPNKIGRIQDFEDNLAYTKVTYGELPGSESRTVDPSQLGTTITKPAGGGRTFMLMKTPQEEYDYGIQEKAERRKRSNTETISGDGIKGLKDRTNQKISTT